MARSFRELRDKMKPEVRARAERRAQEELLEMNLQEIRQHVGELNQTELAKILGVSQGAVSQLEKRGDMHLSKLAEIVAAMGGRLTLKAEFDDGRPAIRINQFDNVKEKLLSG